MSPPENRRNAPVMNEPRRNAPQRTHTQRHAHASRDSKEPRP